MQNIHLELIKIFGLCIYKENQTYFKKNIPGKYKIVINSPEVHFGIKDNMQKLSIKI
jgi:hypothetical protein